MEASMTLKVLSIICIFFISFSSLAFSDKSLELAQSMQLSEASQLGMLKALEDGMKKGQDNQSIYDCIDSKGEDYFDEHFARVIEDILSPSEISEAIVFFKSTAGKKYTQTGFLMLLETLDGQKRELPAFSEDEKRAYLNFAQTRTGVKLIKERILDSAKVQASNHIALRTLYNQCSN